MKRKHPAFVPGKELGAPHFEPFAAADLQESEIAEGTKALWELAHAKGWGTPTEIEKAANAVAKKRTKEVWSHAERWGAKINWNRPEEGPAAAGWILLRNIERSRQIWRSFRRPYAGLRSNQPAEFRKALRMACAFEKGLEPSLREGERHLLALTILLLERKDLDALGREILGGASIGAKGPDKLLVISHGIKSGVGEGWIRADLETVRALARRLEKSLSPAQKDGITRWRRKLAEGIEP